MVRKSVELSNLFITYQLCYKLFVPNSNSRDRRLIRFFFCQSTTSCCRRNFRSENRTANHC
ncbi:hypothetical protein ISN44_As03g043500 [Arabidopsis suecica]|uniref:Uncharacterized protein n=1 Tax=Arabidopsis suecica TaxID=45249 RepID=A0A8T2FDR2_ARASU|nr:hypothetical protein ISN44_As03g043500 [Arabidopsis suecica]